MCVSCFKVNNKNMCTLQGGLLGTFVRFVIQNVPYGSLFRKHTCKVNVGVGVGVGVE